MKEFKKKSIKAFKRDFNNLKIKSPLEIISFIRYNFKYEKRLEGYGELRGYSMDNIRYILNTLEEISIGTSTMHEFVDKLNNLKKVMYESRDNRKGKAVTLSTLHSAKGLEFRRVFMIDLIEGQIPTKESIRLNSTGNCAALEEERRLWYVGMTRAKENLELLTIKCRNNEEIQYSRFIKEIEGFIENNTKKNFSIELKKGFLVRHKKFGLGIIKNIKDPLVTIDFDERGEKQLSIDMCMKRNLLETIEIT